jgi:alpha-amylase/alpha-mannosidase (GH57 family)
MSVLRVVILWHQHQPFYKDLVSGEYRLPWVRLHALKDYYGMVKLLDEFPNVHQTFNLVPSLITQIQDYVAGTAQDPFLAVAAKPARDLSPEERRFVLQYLFQANHVHLIGRYPRYRELSELLHNYGDSPDRAERYFQPQDYTDLQVLSQLAWFDEFFLENPEIAALVKKGRNYSAEDQQYVIARERELLAKVLPAHSEAAKRGSVEISTSPFYHPILPLVCDTNVGAQSTPGLPLPQNRFQHPEDAKEQLQRGLNLHEQVFGMRPKGVWPSEGSVSEEAIAIAAKLGVQWMATDEGVLGRSLGLFFSRDSGGRLSHELASRLYDIYRFEKGDTAMHMFFRDHTVSDLIGFVYSGMPPQEAANHLMRSIKQSAQSVLSSGRDAVVSVILDGENAWEYYPQSGREFLRRFYEALAKDPGVEAVTMSEAIARHKTFAPLNSLVPGSWISANFNVWIGAQEDNRAWDYLYHARNFYTQNAERVTETQRKLALEEILVAEGSDWNWWYGPEHHSANDRDFDELYRKHLSNVYHILGGVAPDYLSHPIAGAPVRATFIHQTAYIHPHITGDMVRYFEWLGAARYTADHRSSAMHGKQFLLDAVYAGIDEANLYGRLDFTGKVPAMDFEIVVNLESWSPQAKQAERSLRVAATVINGTMVAWKVTVGGTDEVLATSAEPASSGFRIVVKRNFEVQMPLAWLGASSQVARLSGNQSDTGTAVGQSAVSRLRVRFSLFRNHLPIDALPVEGWIELHLLSEPELMAMA